MATTLLVQPQQHFIPAYCQYTTASSCNHSAQQTTNLNGEFEVPQAIDFEKHIDYISQHRRATQRRFQRRPSGSLQVRDRTPIRHSQQEMSRHRSSSRPEAFLAYAEGQARQAQPATVQTRGMFTPSSEQLLQSYQTQAYAFPPMSPPYLPQQPYFDPTSGPADYSQPPTQSDASSNQSLYSGPRLDVQYRQGTQGTTMNPTDTLYTQVSAPQLPSMPRVPSNLPLIPQTLESTPNEVDIGASRQKPQCWDHGCNGRQFSTFSNLLRHQREKSGTATKARCPHCGTEFTRTTARNGHLSGGKCKGMPDQGKDDSNQSKEDVP